VNVLGEAVPSTVATVVRGTISRLSPVISWMFIVFHCPVVSASQRISQGLPSLKTFPGSGLVGLGVAETNDAKEDRTKAVKAPRENISGKKTLWGVKKGNEYLKTKC